MFVGRFVLDVSLVRCNVDKLVFLVGLMIIE